jgi:hypothetical protein
MPAIPATVTIGHLRYRIDVDRAAIDKASVKARCTLAGVSNSSEQRIALHPDNAPDYQAETLLHELLHQCLRVSGCDPDQDAKVNLEDVEERAVRSMSGPLLDLLRRNPDLVVYLTTPDPGDGNAP